MGKKGRGVVGGELVLLLLLLHMTVLFADMSHALVANIVQGAKQNKDLQMADRSTITSYVPKWNKDY